jgi:hypothetical protein
MITQERIDEPKLLGRNGWWLAAMASVALAVVLASALSPDMVTGSNHEHLPIAAFVDWLWGAVAIGYLSFVRGARAEPALAISVAVLWLAVAATAILAPVFVTGTDPTSIPLAAMLSPIAGAVATGFLALHFASDRSS